MTNAGIAKAGDLIVVIIDGVPVVHLVAAADLESKGWFFLEGMRALATTINGWTAIDPIYGEPIGAVFAATATLHPGIGVR